MLQNIHQLYLTNPYCSGVFLGKLHAMELFKDTHLVKLELLFNATTIDSALNYIRSKQSQQHVQHKKLASDLTINDDNDQRMQQLRSSKNFNSINAEVKQKAAACSYWFRSCELHQPEPRLGIRKCQYLQSEEGNQERMILKP